MWGLFDVLLEKGYEQVKQRRAFIHLIQFVNLHAATPFLSEEDKIALEKLNEVNAQSHHVPNFPIEKQTAKEKLIITLTILQQNITDLKSDFLTEIAKNIDENVRDAKTIDQLWERIAREFSCLIATNAVDYQHEEVQPDHTYTGFVRAIGIAALTGASILLFRKLGSDFINSNCSIPESINQSIDTYRAMFD